MALRTLQQLTTSQRAFAPVPVKLDPEILPIRASVQVPAHTSPLASMATPRTQPSTSARQMKLPSRSRWTTFEWAGSVQLPVKMPRLPTHTVPSNATVVRDGSRPYEGIDQSSAPVSVSSAATSLTAWTAM